MLFNPFRLISLLFLLSSSLLAQSVDNPQALKNTPDIHVSVQPVRISVGHNLPVWTFEFVPDEDGLIVNSDGYVSGQGQIKISDKQGNVIQLIENIFISIPQSVFGNGQSFFFKDFNHDGWKEMIFTNFLGARGLLVDEFFVFNPRTRQYNREKQMSQIGQIETKNRDCVNITYAANSPADYGVATYCYRHKTKRWQFKQDKKIIPRP